MRVPSYRRSVRRLFDELDERDNEVWFPTPYSWSLDDLISTIEVRGKHVLDVGCGAGNLTLSAATRGGIVSASDVSEAAVATTRGLSERLGLSINVAHSDGIQHWADNGDKFDVIVCNPPCMDLLVDMMEPHKNPFHNSYLLVQLLDTYHIVAKSKCIFVSVVSGRANIDFVKSRVRRGLEPFVVRRQVLMAGAVPAKTAELERQGLVVEENGKWYWDAYFFGLVEF